MCLFVVVVALKSVLKCGIALGHVLVVIFQVGLGEQRPVDGLGGFPAFLAFALAQPLLMLVLRDVVQVGGFFDCWHHVVHHVSIKSQILKKGDQKLFTVLNLDPLIFFVGCGVDSDLERPELKCLFFVHLESIKPHSAQKVNNKLQKIFTGCEQLLLDKRGGGGGGP